MCEDDLSVGLAREVRRRRAAIGVLGAVLVLVGGSWYQAWATPPYRYIDEQAHAGYVLSLQRGQLPTIDSPIHQASGGDALRQRLATEPERRRDVWVANNPPLAYLVALPAATATRALGVPGGPLLGLRLANVAATAAAVALAYRVGRDLAGGDRTVGITTAGIVALLPHVGFVAALGFNDGIALLATTGVLHALVALLTTPTPTPTPTPTSTPTPSECGVRGRRFGRFRAWSSGDELSVRITVLGLWCAAAAAVRPMALAFAAAAGLLALLGTWGRSPLLPTVVRLGGPTAVLAGWWYVANVVRYGDPSGSGALFEKFVREPSGTLLDKVRDNTIWESAFRTVTTRRTDAPLDDPVLWFRAAEAIAVFGVVTTIVLVVLGRRSHGGEGLDATTGGRVLPARAWAAAGVLALVPVVLTAQHAAGGGNPHPRYLLPAVPVLAAAVALAVVRLATRWGAAALLVSLAVLTAVQTRSSIRDLEANPLGAAGSPLATPAGEPWVQALGPIVATVGLVLVVASLVRTPPSPSARLDDDLSPARAG